MAEETRLVRTCIAYPEQYDLFLGKQRIGYFRLRHGHFRVDYPDCGGETVYTASPQGDGEFEDHERKAYLEAATLACLARHYRGTDRPSPVGPLTLHLPINCNNEKRSQLHQLLLQANELYHELTGGRFEIETVYTQEQGGPDAG